MAQTINIKKPKLRGIIIFIIIAIVVIIAIITVVSSIIIIDETERGIKLRFGQVVDENLMAGPHIKLPFVEEIVVVDISNKKIEFGFITPEGASLDRTSYIKDEKVSRMLTGDLNIADVEWVVQYKVENPYYYKFKIENAEETLRDLSEAQMRRFIGNRTLQEILTSESETTTATLENQLQVALQEDLDGLESGIKIINVIIQNLKYANDPEVEKAFKEVVSAEQEQKRLIEEAEKQRISEQEKVDKEYEQIIREAEGYRDNRINTAKGDVSRFVQLYEQYKQYPEITKKRMYLETISKIYKKLKVTIVDSDLVNKSLPLYNLNTGRNQ